MVLPHFGGTRASRPALDELFAEVSATLKAEEAEARRIAAEEHEAARQRIAARTGGRK
jgi:hypothetical protein